LRGKSWSIEEERQLRGLINKGVSIDEIAQIMGKTRLSIRGKMNNLRLSVVVVAAPQGTGATTTRTTTPDVHVDDTPTIVSRNPALANHVDAFAAQLRKDEPLPSIEEKLRVLNAALVALEKPGLSRNEIMRLNKIIEGVKIYQNAYAGFVKYDAIEKEVLELKKQFESRRSGS
jgi:hypothetical protein